MAMLILAAPLALTACAGAAEPPPAQGASRTGPEPARPAQGGPAQRGEASFYHDKFHGRTMANGETFDQNSDSAASKTLPLGTKAQVKNLENGRTATVTIEDRGPFVDGRVVDVSKSTARKLDMVEDGTAPVEVRPLRNN
ncbi:septal ring lytic transglycosylase RlpA family protein [Pseudoroseomonas oryzae]|uniref:Endolytic peptidoglycan transglycosylase RlpA n=2 Tax=Teichococcus oryzae TaxID=1608942 RepID=A0A5B2TN31_9PROT|nr:septal ring lytic transglycosylase RlpA family protein [Pseudoroseomonas oryzae]